MAKTSKGFGELLKQERQKAKHSATAEPKITIAAGKKESIDLVQNLVSPCSVAGIEDFQWEEYYIIEPGSKKNTNN